MLFWHLGLTAAIVFFTLGHRSIDYRVVLLGAILPDLIDKPIGRIFFEEEFQNGRIFGHTLLFSTLLLLAIQLSLRGSAARRWFILPIASLIHVALDGMWNEPVTLFWPLFTTTFPKFPEESYWWEALMRPLEHPATLVKELVGLALLVYIGAAYRLLEASRIKEFMRTGVLRQPRAAGPSSSEGAEAQ
ncbi:MAG: metal-dependent hydrolase [Actinomycetota bacterium]|nr:metal-dependent hydrolase [Actinomycetota bacterium]